MAMWNPWHGCHKYSEGCKYCYMYFLDSQREKDEKKELLSDSTIVEIAN